MSEQEKLTGRQIGVLVTVLALYFITPTHSVINAVSSNLQSVYSVDANAVSLLISITNLLEIPAAFIVGMVAGRKLSYRVCVIVATVLIFIGGLPALMGSSLSWGALLVTRCVLGLGLGCNMPVVLGVITQMFRKETRRAAMMSVANIAFNIGMIAITSGAGILGAISWQYAWVFYLLALIPLILSVFTMTPKALPRISETESGEKAKIKLPVSGWLLLVLFFGSIIMSQSLFNLGGSTIAQVVDNPAIIGTIFSLFSIGAFIPAILFAPFYSKLKATVIPLFWIVGLVGYALWYVAHTTGNVPLFYVAIILVGFGTNSLTIGVPMVLSTLVPAAVAAAVMGFSYVFQNGGGFLATPIDAAVSTIAPDAIMSSVWIFDLVLGIIVLVGLFVVAGKTKKAQAEMANEATETAA